jgi:hypothetical protein
MFRVFAAHAVPGAILMFNAGFGHGEAVGSYQGDPLYHASLDADEYRSLLANSDFELLEHSVNGPEKGGRIVWLARRSAPEQPERRPRSRNSRGTTRGVIQFPE